MLNDPSRRVSYLQTRRSLTLPQWETITLTTVQQMESQLQDFGAKVLALLMDWTLSNSGSGPCHCQVYSQPWTNTGLLRHSQTVVAVWCGLDWCWVGNAWFLPLVADLSSLLTVRSSLLVGCWLAVLASWSAAWEMNTQQLSSGDLLGRFLEVLYSASRCISLY